MHHLVAPGPKGEIMKKWWLGACLGALLAAPAAAQHDHAGGAKSGIAALTAEQMHGLMTGEGLGMALAAELNRYPGPKHVLELADSLAISTEQRQAVDRIRAGMLARAIELGPQIVALERELDALFAGGRAASTDVATLTERIGTLSGRLRAVHLEAHVATRALLTPAQIETYDRLRGHAPGSAGR
jgi:hypothetical protein